MNMIDESRLTRNYKETPLGKIEVPPKEDIEYLFIELGMTISDLVEYFNKGKSSVARWLQKYDIKKGMSGKEYVKLSQDEINSVDVCRLSRDFQHKPWKRGEPPVRSDFEYLYIELNWSAEAVATYLGLSAGRVQTIVNDFNLYKSKEQHNEARSREVQRKYGVSHISKLDEVKTKREQTTLENYGVKSVLCKKEIREDAMKKKYGEKHALLIPEFKKKQEDSLMKSHGVKNICELHEEAKAGVKAKYGVENVFELKEMQERSRYAKLEKYGTTNLMEVPEIKEKVFATNEKRYGVNGSPFASKEIREKAQKSLMKSHGVKNVWEIPGIRQKSLNTLNQKIKNEGITAHPSYAHVKHKEHFNKEYWLKNFVDNRNKCFDVGKCATYHGVGTTCIGHIMNLFGIHMRHKYKSLQEVSIQQYVSSFGIDVEQNYKRLISPQEVDIYIPDMNLAIEYDGLMYHSQGNLAYRGTNNRIGNKYHLDKTVKCAERGVQLLHIFENEWLNVNTREIWKSVLGAKLGSNEVIYARNTKVTLITSAQAFEFCEENHLQGGSKSPINYGLITKDTDELVAVMTFSKARFNKAYQWELVRFCSKKFISVVGGASKLLKAFRKDNKGSIISYANRRWSDGGMYEALGFKRLGATLPNYFYFKTKDGITPETLKLHSRVEFQKHKLKDKLEKFDPEKTELENMYENGYRTIYDCGNFTYVLVD